MSSVLNVADLRSLAISSFIFKLPVLGISAAKEDKTEFITTYFDDFAILP